MLDLGGTGVSDRIVVLGAGFGGLELCTILSGLLGEDADVTLIDKSDTFVFGFSKLDIMFRRAPPDSVRMRYSDLVMPGVRVLRETITAIDPDSRRVSTDTGTHAADVLVVALGADYDMDATPGLAEGANEFYSVAGAERLAGIIPSFSHGHAVIGICGAPFKCPPAPSECALMLDDELRTRGVRDACEISIVMPLGTPVPPSPETSAALEQEFAARDIALLSGRRVAALDPPRRVAVLDDSSELPYDLFLGVPKHRAPDVVISSGMTEDGYIPVDSATLETRYPDVYAIGDVATAGVPKAGVFAEGAARVVAQAIAARRGGGEPPERHLGRGTCYIEFGQGRIGSVDIDFLSGPTKTGTFNAPSAEQMSEKQRFGSSRRARWFGA
jgi:sulfide:quinone oxidoreductase